MSLNHVNVCYLIMCRSHCVNLIMYRSQCILYDVSEHVVYLNHVQIISVYFIMYRSQVFTQLCTESCVVFDKFFLFCSDNMCVHVHNQYEDHICVLNHVQITNVYLTRKTIPKNHILFDRKH